LTYHLLKVLLPPSCSPEHLKRLRHEHEIRALHHHFEPLITTASSLVNRVISKPSDIGSPSLLYCMLPDGAEQHSDVAVTAEPEQQPSREFSSSPSSQFTRIPLPPPSSSSPAAEPPATLLPSTSSNQNDPIIDSGSSSSSSSSNNLQPDEPPSFSNYGINASYRRSIVIRHTQNKLL
jgi:hypothetical protein